LIDIGIIGFGNMGQWMAESFSQIEEVRVASVAEVAPANIQAGKARGIPVYTDYRRLLDQPLDGVYIATPNALHKENVLAAAARSIPILCEKPIALTLADACEMVRAVEATNVPTLVNFKCRFMDALERLRAYLTDGQLGDLLACWFRTFRGYGFYGAGVRHPAVVRPDLSGGWVVHHAIHATDWLIYIGGPVESVAAHTFRSVPDAPSSEGIFGMLGFFGGAVAHLADSVVGYRERAAGIVGTRGTATYDKGGLVRFHTETGTPEKGEEVLIPASERGQHAVARHFVAVVRGEEAPRVTLQDGQYALKVVLALLESAETGTIVTL
jgi:1,5-anhydro-D-fructose reductase (1,5-anhydro-D-mannitol-forming)